MRLSSLLWSTAFCWSNVALAQSGRSATPKSTRAIAFRDTLGANFDIADSARKHGTPADYDFLTGLWVFRFQSRNADGSFDDAFTGHWSAQKRSLGAGNGMIEDHWRADAPNDTWDEGTYTYRVFSPDRKLWTFQGVHSNVGFWQPGLSWSDASNRYVVERYDGFLMRMRYFDITPTSFLWRGDMSRNGGKTWTRDWWTMEGRRIGK